MIEISNLSKKYGNSRDFAVQNVNISCKNGVTFLIGPNGAGKSTIMKALLCLHYPNEGKIKVSGFDSEENPSEVKKNTGYVQENPNLPKHLTVREYLKDVLLFHGLESEGDAFKNTVKECQLESILDKKISSLSKGFIQRTALASAIIFEPENLVLDEPLTALDPSQIIHMRKVISDYGKNHTVLVSTHIMQEVSALSTYIYIISEGKIQAEGTEDEILEKTEKKSLEEAFLLLCGDSDSKEAL